jgi:hypothetical protein
MDGSTGPTLVSVPAELLISIFGWLEAADIMALRVTSALLHRLTFDDAGLWRPLYLKTFGHSRPCKPASHTPESSSNAELWQDYRLHIPQAKVVDTLIRRFQQTWEWAYKVRTLIHCTDAWSAIRLRLVCNSPFVRRTLEQGVGLGGAHAQRGNVLRHAQGEVPARALGGAP